MKILFALLAFVLVFLAAMILAKRRYDRLRKLAEKAAAEEVAAAEEASAEEEAPVAEEPACPEEEPVTDELPETEEQQP